MTRVNRFGHGQTPTGNPFRSRGVKPMRRLEGVRFDQAIGLIRLLASYECAGEPACVGRDRMGDHCGPCDAADWLRSIGVQP